MRRLLLSSLILPLAALVTILGASLTLQASDNSNAKSTGSISGRVLDAATKKPVAGTVVVALESQPGDGSIVNATSPDGNGHFNFTQVRPGNYAIVITGVDAAKKSYTPLLVTGKGIAPGANLGMIALQSSGNGVANLDVPVQSNKPITVTLTVNQKVGDYSVTLPWADGTPTFDTLAQQECSTGGACSHYRLQVPASQMLMATFDGTALRYSSKPLATRYSVVANAYTQNGARPTCDSHASAPLELQQAGGAAANAIVFSGCE
jgi:hypothetical protein